MSIDKTNSAPKVINTTHEDLPTIYNLFEESVRYQEINGLPSWKNYDRQTLINDIETSTQYKIVIEDAIAIVFTIRRQDAIIWRHHERGDAVYLHRVVVNPRFKGKKLFGHILSWAVQYCKDHRLKFVRMDTWANNPNLIQYYSNFGFRFVENYTTPDTQLLPAHNRNLALVLLEFEIL